MGVPTPRDVTRIDVTSAAQMADAVMLHVDGHDVFVGVAAVADYTPVASTTRRSRSRGSLTITLKPTIDILATVAALPQAPFCVGFAAETENVEQQADAKRKRKRVPLLVANRAQDAIGSDDNEVTLLDDEGATKLPRMDKLPLPDGSCPR